MPKKICNGVTLNALTTKKFKTSMFMVTYVLPLTRENAAGCSLLSGVLKRGSKSFPTLRDISIRREELYSASLSYLTQKSGEALYFSAYTSFLDNAYVPDGSDLFASSLELLSDVLYSPLVERDEFNSNYVNSEKENLINLISEKLNNKASYSVDRCLSLMCENEPFSIPASGYIDDVKAYDGKKLYELYKHIIADTPTIISYAGSQDEATVLNYVNKKLPPFAPRDSAVPVTDTADPGTPPATVIEELPAAQGKLTIGMRIGIDSAGVDYPAFALFNEVYGGAPSSKLFTVIREKMSLCYYCSTGGDRYKNVLFVTSGIENENFEKARDGILAQL
ncbi:MAG TPA: insulinase family protein, partial [Bacillota bacterium]|nr:insulinase family protein [Bacillota bacterium]